MFRHKCTIFREHNAQGSSWCNKLNTLTLKCTERSVLKYSGTNRTLCIFLRTASQPTKAKHLWMQQWTFGFHKMRRISWSSRKPVSFSSKQASFTAKHSQALVNAVMNLRAPQNAGNVLTSWKPVSFSRSKQASFTAKHSHALVNAVMNLRVP
jgi:hypothetical protein